MDQLLYLGLGRLYLRLGRLYLGLRSCNMGPVGGI